MKNPLCIPISYAQDTINMRGSVHRSREDYGRIGGYSRTASTGSE